MNRVWRYLGYLLVCGLLLTLNWVPAVLAKPLVADTPTLFARPVLIRVIPFTQLPPEARQTIRLIQRGGPFPYDRDGVVFGNFEGILPRQSRGYYREYTVITPGSDDRGARRIVAGRNGEFYYTRDHYKSFLRVRLE